MTISALPLPRATVKDPTQTCIKSQGNSPARREPQMVHPERQRVSHPWRYASQDWTTLKDVGKVPKEVGLDDNSNIY